MKGKKKKRQLFIQYDEFNGDTFLEFLNKMHVKFSKCYLFMDKASPHYTCKKVIKYFEDNKDTLIPVYSHCYITIVYGYGKGREYSKTRSTCFKILYIIWRVEE